MTHADLLARIELLERDNLRLAQKKSGNQKPTTFVFFYHDGRLCTGSVEKAVGKDMHIRTIFPTDESMPHELIKTSKELLTIDGIDREFQALKEQIIKLRDLLRDIRALAAQGDS